MESRKKISNGEVTALGELVAGDTVVRTVGDYQILKIDGPVTKNPFVIKVEAGGNVPLQPYVFARINVGLECPVDISRLSLDTAYDEALEIVMGKCSQVLEAIKEDIFLIQKDQTKPSKTEVPEKPWEEFDDEIE